MTAPTLPGYLLEATLGQGSMGTVHLARRTDWAGRLVAVKRVPHAGSGLTRTLRHEAEVLAALDHPHIVRILDLVSDGDGVAIAMQYAAGGSLPELLARRGRLTPGEVVAVAAPVADALASAHRRGLLHCDVKPANLLFTSDGEPLLSDFGLARRMGHVGATGGRLGPGSVAGTAEYLDPAVVAGAPADERSDVYGLGVVCYELLAGGPPFTAATPEAVLDAAVAGGPLPLGTVAPGTPLALVHAVERAMARQPADRFADAAAFAAALRSAVSPTPVIMASPTPPPSLRQPAGPTPQHAEGAPAGEQRPFGPVQPVVAGPARAEDHPALGYVGAGPTRVGAEGPGADRPAPALLPPSGPGGTDLRRPTRMFGPRPPQPVVRPATPEHRWPPRRLLFGAAGLALVVAIGAAVLLRSGAEPHPSARRPATAAARSCPAVAAPRLADVDGDGCPSAVFWKDNVVSVDGRRYGMGRPGDQLLLGDWDCNGTDTPALYRPSTGLVFVFDGWAEAGQGLPAGDGGRFPVDGTPTVAHEATSCDRVIVEGR